MVWVGAANAIVLAQRGRRTVFPGRRAGFANCSIAGLLVRWLRRSGPGRLPPQVGAGDDPGQDAQPRLPPLPLLLGVVRGRCPWGLPSDFPGFPAVPAKPRWIVSSGVVSHILSLVACDRASVSSWVCWFRIISFTLYWFGLAASLPLLPESVSNGLAAGNYL